MSDSAKEHHEKDEVESFSNITLFVFSLLGSIFQLPFLFIPAGTWNWPEAWIYLAVFFVYMTFNVIYLNKKNPEILRNRIQYKKEGVKGKAEGSDKWRMPLLSAIFVIEFILPGFDERYGWSEMYIVLNVLGFVGLGLGLYFIFTTMLENAYASKVLDVRKDKGHKVIDTGPYAHVRHPMYSGFILMFISVPFCLDCWYALIPGVAFFALIMVRINYEEEMLIKQLDGYEKYRKKVKYKIIPKIL